MEPSSKVARYLFQWTIDCLKRSDLFESIFWRVSRKNVRYERVRKKKEEYDLDTDLLEI